MRLDAKQEDDGRPSERTTAVRNLNKVYYFVFISFTAIPKLAESL